MKKRFLSAILALSMALSLFSVPVSAARDAGGGIYFSAPAAQTELGAENSNAQPIEVLDGASFLAAAEQVNSGSGTYEIILQNDIELSEPVPFTNGDVTITGNGRTIKPAEGFSGTTDAALLQAGNGVQLTLDRCVLDGASGCRGISATGDSVIVILKGSTIQNCITTNSSGAGALVSGGARLEMTDSTITGCTAQNSGGGASLESGTSTLVLNGSSKIENCSAKNRNGGGVAMFGSGSRLVLNDTSAITGCKANANGGGISAGDSTSTFVEMHDASSVSGCSAAHFGGGIYLQGITSSLTMDGSSKITGCYTTANTSSNGGGAYLAGSSNTMTMSGSSKITDCSAYEDGGAAYLAGENASLNMNTGSTIENCKSEGTKANGGGVYLYGANASLTMDGSTIKGCSASVGSGGGVYVSGASASLTVKNDSTITGCNASSSGGGIYSSGSSASLNINGSTISDCTASTNGGGVYSSSTLNMENSKITDCKASGSTSNGGGVYFSGSSATMNGSTVENCTATQRGGGVFLFGYSSVLELTNGSSISSCTAGNGGGICAYRYGAPQSAKLTLTDSKIEGCKATATDGCGGGIYLYGSNSVVLESSSLVDCSAANGEGGGICLNGANDSLTLNSSSISGCDAADGGGICLNGSSAQLFAVGDSSITGCSASNNGGGIYFYGAGADLHQDALTSGEAEITITNCHASVSGGGVFVDSHNGRACSLDFSGGTIYNNNADTSGSDFYLGKADYNVTLPIVAGKNLPHSTDGKVIDGWYYDPNTEGIHHTPTNSAGRVNTGVSSSTVSLSDGPCALVACSAMYNIVFDGPYAADCSAYSDSDCTTAITAAAPGDTVYLKYTGTLADGTRMNWAAVTDGDDADSRAVSVSASSRICASFTMPAANINHQVTVTPAAAAVTRYTIQVIAPEDSSADAVTVVSSAEESQTVSLAFDITTLPKGKAFGSWAVKKAGENGDPVAVTSPGSINTSFTMPASDVVVTFTLKDADEPDTPDTPDTPSDGGSGDGGAGAVIAGAVVGTAGYLVGTELWLYHLYGYVPATRIRLALALWDHADRPEPESTELYSDIDKDDTAAQQAARWCVEQNLLRDYHDQKSDGTEEVTFKPCHHVFRLKAIKTWYDLEKLLNEQQQSES